MPRERAARRSGNYERAKTSSYRADVDIVQQRTDRDWRRGTLWAGVGMVLVWGPLLLMHASGVF